MILSLIIEVLLQSHNYLLYIQLLQIKQNLPLLYNNARENKAFAIFLYLLSSYILTKSVLYKLLSVNRCVPQQHQHPLVSINELFLLFVLMGCHATGTACLPHRHVIKPALQQPPSSFGMGFDPLYAECLLQAGI
ncbi:hypothetical protein FGO68_gene14890 [Halteria grandinella]|uniref:Uncharacterized protein n=1 Tax=Halteria grandinella TaxID=5974 RepID=A0A8J8NEB9_HALGN|nr:hypothetical protein FGO68_gene14890 [Halteria grandinella]